MVHLAVHRDRLVLWNIFVIFLKCDLNGGEAGVVWTYPHSSIVWFMLRIVRIQTQRVHELLFGHSRSNGHSHLHSVNQLGFIPRANRIFPNELNKQNKKGLETILPPNLTASRDSIEG